MEYISREDYCEENCGKENREGYKTCKNCSMLNVPSADVQPIKHGRWIADNKDNRGYADCYTCTNCDDYVYTFTLMKDCEFEYCPNCGARMDGDAE